MLRLRRGYPCMKCHQRLKEILAPRTPSRRHRSFIVGHGTKDGKLWVQVFLETHDGCDVAASVAIVWSRPNRHYVFVLEMILHKAKLVKFVKKN